MPPDRYDGVARTLHWVMALLLIGLVGLGFYVTSLTYYEPLYHKAAVWHRSLGVVAFLLVLIRLGWRLGHAPPPLPGGMPAWEVRAAHATHHLLYLLMLVIPITGYLVTTADGRGVNFFGWFEIPAVLPAAKGREEIMGRVHLGLGITLILLVTGHVLAALKHQFIDKDHLLRRMWQ